MTDYFKIEYVFLAKGKTEKEVGYLIDEICEICEDDELDFLGINEPTPENRRLSFEVEIPYSAIEEIDHLFVRSGVSFDRLISSLYEYDAQRRAVRFDDDGIAVLDRENLCGESGGVIVDVENLLKTANDEAMSVDERISSLTESP